MRVDLGMEKCIEKRFGDVNQCRGLDGLESMVDMGA